MRNTQISIGTALAWIGFGGLSIAQATTLPPVSSGTLELHLVASTGVTTSSGSVTNWADQSGQGNDFANPTTASEPTLVGTLNGQPLIHFNGGSILNISNNNTLNSATLGSAFTYFMVTANATNPEGSFDSAPFQGNVFRFYSDSNNANYDQLWQDQPAVPITLHATGSVVAVRATANGGGRFLENTEYSSAASPVVTSATSTDTAGIAWTNPAIGSINGLSIPYAGDIAEIVIYQGELSPADEASVAHALAATYALPEPASFAMLGVALIGLLARRRQG